MINDLFKKYLHILESYKDIYYDTSSINEDYFTKSCRKVSCHNCNNTHFFTHNGYRYCNKCFHSIGHILGYNEITEISKEYLQETLSLSK